MNKVFELVNADSEQVVLKVNADDPLVVAMNPYISGDYAYITVSRGEKHILVITKKDGSTFSFHWGIGGYTLIGENLERLKKKVVEFIEKDCMIPLNWDGEIIIEASVFYNNNYKNWQLTLRGKDANGNSTSGYVWPGGEKEDVMDYAERLIGYPVEWDKGIASTGIDVWDAEI